MPKDAKAVSILKKRTLTNLYNERPAWLANAHRNLDEAVAAAYGWPGELSDEEVLKRLFDLNQDRAKIQALRRDGSDLAEKTDNPPARVKAAEPTSTRKVKGTSQVAK
jgi:hypothetical protein